MNRIKGSLVLEGGASRGVFTAGVLDYLLEKGINFEEVIGVSAGSLNALGYVAEQKGRTKDTMIHEKKVYSNINLRDFNKNKSILDMNLMFEDFPHEIFPLDFETIFNSDTNLHIGVSNCETGKVEYFKEREDRYRLMTLSRASSSLPLITPIVRIDDKPFLDGGLADAVPIKYAQSLGHDKIVIVLTRNPGYRKVSFSKGVRRIYERAYKKYPEFIRLLRRRAGLYNRTMEYIENLEAKGDIFVIRPQVPTVKRMETEAEKLTAFYDHGYQLMDKEYDNLMKYLMK